MFCKKELNCLQMEVFIADIPRSRSHLKAVIRQHGYTKMQLDLFALLIQVLYGTHNNDHVVGKTTKTDTIFPFCLLAEISSRKILPVHRRSSPFPATRKALHFSQLTSVFREIIRPSIFWRIVRIIYGEGYISVDVIFVNATGKMCTVSQQVKNIAGRQTIVLLARNTN